MPRLTALALGLLSALALAPPASAAVIYDEAVRGDLPDIGAPLPTLDLLAGTNTVRGAVAFSFQGPVPTDFDAFAFTVPAGTTLAALSISVSLRPEGAGLFDEVIPLLNDSMRQVVPIPATGQSLFVADLPLGPGVGSLALNNHTGTLFRGEYRIADYEITLTVRGREPTAVPGPGALWPLLAGLAGLGLVRRRFGGSGQDR